MWLLSIKKKLSWWLLLSPFVFKWHFITFGLYFSNLFFKHLCNTLNPSDILILALCRFYFLTPKFNVIFKRFYRWWLFRVEIYFCLWLFRQRRLQQLSRMRQRGYQIHWIQSRRGRIVPRLNAWIETSLWSWRRFIIVLPTKLLLMLILLLLLLMLCNRYWEFKTFQ